MEGDNDRVGDIRFQTRISAVVAVADLLIHSFVHEAANEVANGVDGVSE